MKSERADSGVLLVGHGTRDATGTRQFFELSKRLAETLSPTPVEPCLLEFQEPTIPMAWDRLVQHGVQHVQVAPLLLFAAGHAKQDIPDLVAECQARTPSVTVSQSGPLSRHESIVDLLLARIEAAFESVDESPRETALVMVGRGSYDPCAQADMRVLTEIIKRRTDYAHVTTAFYAMAEPKLPDVLDQVASIESVKRVLVQPHLLFEGRLFQAIQRQVTEAAERTPTVSFTTANYLGPESNVALAIAARLGAR